jgi:hypothetical protein
MKPADQVIRKVLDLLYRTISNLGSLGKAHWVGHQGLDMQKTPGTLAVYKVKLPLCSTN